MDKQDTTRNLLIAALVFMGIMFVAPRFFPEIPVRTQPDSSETGTTTPGAGQSADTLPTTPDATVVRPDAATTPSQPPSDSPFTVVGADAEQTVSLGAAVATTSEEEASANPYRMHLTLSNVGASIESSTMTNHAATLNSDERYELLRKLERDNGRVLRSLAIEKINLDGINLHVRDTKWHVGPVEPYENDNGVTGEHVSFWVEIRQGDTPLLKLTRTFTLPAQQRDLRRHDLYSNIAVENRSGQPHEVILTYLGGLGIGRINPRMDDRLVDAGIHDGTRVSGLRKERAKLTKSATGSIPLYEPSPEQPQAQLAWAATANTYFTCTIAPTTPAGSGIGGYINKAFAVDADGDVATEDDATVRFFTHAATIAPGVTHEYRANIYLGEKNGDAFSAVSEYSDLNYYYQVSQGYGWCTFIFLVELMIWLLNGLFWLVRDFGVAIIILVLIVRTLLHPITKKGQVNMVKMQSRMQEIQPKIEEIKRKYANDKARMNQEMMKLNINPAGQLLTCLPMLIQMPIWIALYISLSNNILMRHEGALYGLTWIHDLTASDALYTFGSPIHVPLFGWELPAFNLLPILLAIFMYLQQKLQPKPKPNPSASDQQRQQQEMMQKMGPMMSIMMLLIFYKMPSGLNLYIMTSSLFGIIEQHRIRKHIKEREAAGTLHKEPVKDKPDTKQRNGPGKLNFFQKLQKMAEDAKAQQSKGRSKDKARR